MASPWSRRGFLRATGGSALALTLVFSGRTAFAADELAVLRGKWRDLLLGTGFDHTADPFKSELAALGKDAAGFRATMDPAGGSLWPGLDFTDSQLMNDSLSRLRTMALAHAQPGTGLTGDGALRDDVLTGLDHVYEQVYNERQERFGNWWNWQIGGPHALLDTAVLLHSHLSADQVANYCAAVDHFVPDSMVDEYSGVSTGANRVDLCRTLVLRGLVGDRAEKVALASDALSPVFPYVTEGDGLYADGSFIQHTYVPYSGTYGSVLLGGLGLLFSLFAGSAWEVTDPKRQNFLDAVEHAWAPFLYNGLVMDGVSGRAISRGLARNDVRQIQQDDHERGHAIVAAIALLAGGASAAERERWRGLVKGWIERAYYRPLLTSPKLGVPRLALLKEIHDDGSVEPVAEPVGHRLFAAMDRATHHRPGWAASVSMASRRITHYETGNGENLRGWHTSSGMLYWWGAEFGDGQYSDAFWPTVDPYRLPGITVSRKRLADGAGGDWGAPRPDADWVGGTTDGEFAALGQDFRGISSTLRAKKSWFCLDDAIVCLGAAIRCSDGETVESVVDNRNLGEGGRHRVVVDGTAKPQTGDWSETLGGVSWVQLDGFGGYVFPGGGTVEAVREDRTGSWSDINENGTEDEFTRRYLTLWFDHGTDPQDASYAHLVLPGADPGRTAARAADSGWLDILANSGDRQGIHVPALGFTGVNFWAGGTAGKVTATEPCSVLVREVGGGEAVICVADPERKRAELTVSWERAVAEVLSKPETVTGVTTGRALRLTFGDLRGVGGVSQVVRVRVGGAAG